MILSGRLGQVNESLWVLARRIEDGTIRTGKEKNGLDGPPSAWTTCNNGLSSDTGTEI